jgi:hypothetical protein
MFGRTLDLFLRTVIAFLLSAGISASCRSLATAEAPGGRKHALTGFSRSPQHWRNSRQQRESGAWFALITD